MQVEPAEETMVMRAYVEPQPDHAAVEIPVQHEPGFEPTIPEKPVEVVSAADPELQPSFAEQGQAEISAAADPALLAESSALQSFPTKFGMENAEEVPVGIASELPDVTPESAATPHREAPGAEVSEDDFDARVAAALAAYDQAAELETVEY